MGVVKWDKTPGKSERIQAHGLEHTLRFHLRIGVLITCRQSHLSEEIGFYNWTMDCPGRRRSIGDGGHTKLFPALET